MTEAMKKPAHPDWFPGTIAGPDAVTLRALGRPGIVTLIAAARLIGCTNPTLRGDGITAGHSIICDSIPVMFPLKIDHTLRRPVAKLARLVKDPELLARVEHLITQEEIQAEVRRLAGNLAHNMKIVVGMLQSIAKKGLCS